MYGSNYGTTTDAGTIAAAFGAIVGAMIGLFVVIIALVILMLVANYKLFQKMGYEGWKGLIPGVDTYLVLEKIGISQKWLLLLAYGSFICIVPILGALAFLVAAIYFAVLYAGSLAKSFGKSTGFAVGLFFLSPIFMLILAFGDSKYIGPTPMNDILFGQKK